ncbi:MAG TPA: hypothetical protein VK494_02630 [Gemmatimonadaceae bacterium]|nr:hypothetical protein [Gemmatimonadaceae bacterium]
MKSRFFWALYIGASAIGATTGAQTTGHATRPVSAPAIGTSVASPRASQKADSVRSYDTQALRFEARWGSADIIRGADGPTIGTVGLFRSFELEKLVESSPHAVAEARAFERDNFAGSVVGALGAVTLGIGAIVTSNSSNNASSPVLIIAGAGAIAWGVQHLNRGYSSLSRALWWYNRDLHR